MKRKIVPLSLCLYLLSAVFIVCGILSVAACYKNISVQLLQGITVEGNELAILSLYLQSAAPYLAYAALLFVAGRLYLLVAPPKFKEPPPDEIPEAMNADPYAPPYGGQAEEESDDFQGWGSDFTPH